MALRLSKNVEVAEVQGGIALFDAIRQDTHFIPPPCASLIPLLKQGKCTKLSLYDQLRKLSPEYSDAELSTFLKEFLASAESRNLIEAY